MKGIEILEKSSKFTKLWATKYPDGYVYIRVGSNMSAYCIGLDPKDRKRLVDFLKETY